MTNWKVSPARGPPFGRTSSLRSVSCLWSVRRPRRGCVHCGGPFCQARVFSPSATIGGCARTPTIRGIGADPGHHEQRRPKTRLPTEASGCRSIMRMSTAQLVWHPGQWTSSQGMLAISAARIVGDHRVPRSAASAAFQRSMTRRACSRPAFSSARVRQVASMSGRRVRTPMPQSYPI